MWPKKTWKSVFLKNIKFAIFSKKILSNFFRFVIISPVIYDPQERTIPQIKAKGFSFWPYLVSFLAITHILWGTEKWSCFTSYVTNIMNTKNCKIWHFLKYQFFRFFIISVIIFDLQECTIPQIKAKEILFWPYFVRFLAKINISWDRK